MKKKERDYTMEDTIICPVCKADLDFEYSAFKLDNFNGESGWFKSYGHCPECGRKYRWFEEFKFAGASEPVCIDEREE